ncbi:MAG: hypothetical protein DRP87_02480 [Spirochaetes bacterium]|mgnify:CR=1 FL=1|nr:MAG: hypothetical protein DRP87_02480 [Spirochaetota bacterium]
MEECCSGSDTPTRLLYACSGVANTGYLADSVARRLMKGGTGKMTCLAAMGAGYSRFIEDAKKADCNIVIDGCPISCGKQIFEKLGLPFNHYKTTDYGIEKGKTVITEEIMREVTEKLKGEITNGGC